MVMARQLLKRLIARRVGRDAVLERNQCSPANNHEDFAAYQLRYSQGGKIFRDHGALPAHTARRRALRDSTVLFINGIRSPAMQDANYGHPGNLSPTRLVTRELAGDVIASTG
jgi:hypothetical protein